MYQCLIVVVAVPALGSLYVDGPPTAHTGGFGEPTCHSCHFSEPMNSSAALADILGVPHRYVGDSVYTLTVFVGRQDIGAGGFSVSSRFPNGKQAGVWEPLDGRSEVQTAPDAVEYAMHTFEGTEPLSGDSTSWQVRWTAPSSIADTVIFHLAANAANGDDSELGDFIVTDSAQALPNP